MGAASESLEIWMFGKEGCAKCKALQRRLKKLLKDERWADFSMRYFDVETEEGLVRFCRVECINPNRIPAFVIAVPDESSATGYRLLPDPTPEDADALPGALYGILGIQTDYSTTGTITPAMIERILEKARDVACLTTN